MRYIFTILKGNIRKNKGVYISIILLMFFLSLSVTATISVYCNSHERIEKAMGEVGYKDFMIWFDTNKSLENSGIEPMKYAEQLAECDFVEDIDVIDAVYLALLDCNGNSNGNLTVALNQSNEYLSFDLYDENTKPLDIDLKKDEVAVPVCFKSTYGCKIGDEIEYGWGDFSHKYKVVAYLEDPCMGTSFMGIKTIVMSDEDYESIISGDNAFMTGKIFNIAKKDKGMSSLKFEKEINKATECCSVSIITLSKDTSAGYMLILINIFSAILVVFAVILFVATIIVLGHNINSSIQQDYVNLGILKSFGMTSRDIKKYIILGYSVSAALGLLLGIPVAKPLAELIADVMLTSVGVFVPCKLKIGIILILDLGIMAFIVVFSLIKLIKISKISPVVAINSGKNSVYFSSILRLPISRKMLDLSIAFRQFVTGRKKYRSAMIITALLTVFMILVSSSAAWLRDGEAIQKMFWGLTPDVQLYSEDLEVVEEAEKFLLEQTDAERFYYDGEYLTFEDMLLHATIVDNPELYDSVYKGRTCEYPNEVVVTQYILDNLDLEIGDTVKIGFYGKSAEFVISGVYDCANDTGKNFAINYEGFKKILPENKQDIADYTRSYYVDDSTDLNELRKKFQDKYEDEDMYWILDEEKSGMEIDVINTAVSAIGVIIYILAGIFVIITVVLICSKIFSEEKQDYGIYKSFGFNSLKIRLHLSIRFIISSLIGSALGIILTMLFGNLFMESIFKSFGIYNATGEFGLSSMLISVIYMAIVYFAVSFSISRKIKKVDPRILVNE